MTYEFSIENVNTKEALHERIAKTLPVPGYYGKNLDALHDVLTSLPTDTNLEIWIDSDIDLTDPATIPPHLKGFFRVMANVAEEREDIGITFYSPKTQGYP